MRWIFSASAASEFYDWVQVEIDVYISYCKYQVKPHLSPWFHLSPSDKVKLFAENFFKNFNLDDSSIFLPFFSSRTNLKLHNIYVTPKMVKVLMNLDLSKASGPDCIQVVVLKNCEPELSYIPAELFNKCLEESCITFPERSTAKNYLPVSLLSLGSKVFEKLVNSRIVDHLEKCGLFDDFRYGFRSF